jgi:2-C-methyl-D-erythritol 4-phosphate cytidylyltransferase
MASHAIIVAAGQGKRFGGKKQFYQVRGYPLYSYAIRTFEDHEQVKSITLVVPKIQVKKVQRYVRGSGFKKVRRIVAGGSRRQDSVANGLRAIREKNGIVIIHDAVRPLVSKKMIRRGITLCRKYRAVIPGVNAYDTVKRVAKWYVQETIARDDLFLIQTPQFYDLGILRKAIVQADFRLEFTDEAALLESLGLPVRIFAGDRYNIKVTDKQDLKLVEKMVS